MLFEEFLQALCDSNQRLRASQLVRFSHLAAEQRDRLASIWPAIESRRRLQVIRQLVSLAEDNVELNFDAVFLLCLSDPDPQVRIEAIRGLWEYEGRDLIAPLLNILAGDDEVQVRAEAALALGRFVLLSEYGNLRENYFRQVEAGLRRVLDDHLQPLEVRARALEAVGACSRPWVRQAIHDAYESDRQRLKVSAIHAMGRSCESRWLPVLLRELSSEEAEVRYEAALACGSIADEAAVPYLGPLLEDNDPEVQAAAIAALGEIGGAEARSLLAGVVNHPSAMVREAAREALAEIDFGEDPLSFRFRP